MPDELLETREEAHRLQQHHHTKSVWTQAERNHEVG